MSEDAPQYEQPSVEMNSNDNGDEDIGAMKPEDMAKPETKTDIVESSDDSAASNNHQEQQETGEHLNSFPQRLAKRMARNPCIHLIASILIALGLSAVGIIIGEFSVAVDNAGWQSRGTLIADRQTQLMMAQLNTDQLFDGSDEDWQELIDNVQPGWESGDEDLLDRRRLEGMSPEHAWKNNLSPIASGGEKIGNIVARPPAPLRMNRELQVKVEDPQNQLPGCDMTWYQDYDKRYHLWPVWKTKKLDSTALSADLVYDLCEAELQTQRVLEERDLCFGCEDGCLPPFGLVFYTKLTVPGGINMTCSELRDAWEPYEEETAEAWSECVEGIKANFDPTGFEIPEACPYGFSADLVQWDFDQSELLIYTSSVFPTREEDVDEIYDINDKFGKGTEEIEGAYDTKGEDFSMIFTEAAVARDMALAMGSACVTALAIMVHTRSPFLTIIGLLQIVLSFPLAYFMYTMVAQLEFFPFLNFIGVFVVFALGAGDVFVAVDKWKNARIDHPKATVEHIAALALPDAAGAMFLTTITTAIAFFGTAICPVAPIKLFAIFCGLLIMFDYIMCVLLVFPALCIYDRKRETKPNCCIVCHCCHRLEAGGEHAEDEESKPSLIRRILLGFYWFLHTFRWPLLLVCAAGLGVSAYFASTLELPTSAEVRIVDDSYEFEKSYTWRQELLSTVLQKSGGAECNVIFGVKPADTGDQNDPNSWSQLVLDHSFDPSTEEAQEYLAGFCANMFENDFADTTTQDYECPINRFGSWLEQQSELRRANDTASDVYNEHCVGATGIPVPQNIFHPCMSAWAVLEEEITILSRENVVTIMLIPFTARVRWDSPFEELDDEWNLIEDWMDGERGNAPDEVSNYYFSNLDFWWYDTNKSMLSTAYGAAGIALGAAGAVILLSSRSVLLTIYSVVTIGYILTSVTATLVGFGWTLGFLESICFAILIGVSVDFIIHFAHSYAKWKGEHDRGERTKHALIIMGPSILATAFTTFCAAVVMMFTIIIFFQKFALILFMTIVQATVGTFIVFLTMADTMGPTHPTYLVDKATSCCSKQDEEEKNDEASLRNKEETAELSALHDDSGE